MPSIPVTVFLAGCVLVVAGIFGGGFKVYGVTIPKLKNGARLSSAVFGAFLALFAVFDKSLLPDSGHPPVDLTPDQIAANGAKHRSTTPEFFVVSSELEDGEIFEHLRVFVSGEKAFDLVVDEKRHRDSVRMPVTDENSCAYVLDGLAGTNQGDGKISSDELSGTGQVDCSSAGSFEVYRARVNGKTFVELIPSQARNL